MVCHKHYVHFRSGQPIPFEISDPALGFIPINTPAHSILTVAWATQ